MRMCECGSPVWGTDKNTRIGYCKSHQYKRTDLDRRSIVQKAMDKANGKDESSDDKNELQKWFEDRRKEMTGKCVNCGGKTEKNHDKYFKFSIGHILPKAYFHSVATNEFNWIELCHFGNGCHNAMDTKMLDLIDMNCWDEIVTKFCIMYPHIAKDERRRIPQILLDYMENNK